MYLHVCFYLLAFTHNNNNLCTLELLLNTFIEHKLYSSLLK